MHLTQNYAHTLYIFILVDERQTSVLGADAACQCQATEQSATQPETRMSPEVRQPSEREPPSGEAAVESAQQASLPSGKAREVSLRNRAYVDGVQRERELCRLPSQSVCRKVVAPW